MAARWADEESAAPASTWPKQAIEAALTARRGSLADAELQAQLQAQALDVSLRGASVAPAGCAISLTMERIEQIFASMGFDVADGPRSKPTGTASPH